MAYSFSFSKANGEAAILLGVAAFAGDYLVTFTSFEPSGLVRALGAAILAGAAAFGLTGVSSTP